MTGSLPAGLPAVAFDGDDVGGVHRAHHVEVLALVAQLDEFLGEGLKAHAEPPWLGGLFVAMGRFFCGEAIGSNEFGSARLQMCRDVPAQRLERAAHRDGDSLDAAVPR